ncbi:MAG: DUF1571 domain-containing protein [Planctomycetaceae bacterium]
MILRIRAVAWTGLFWSISLANSADELPIEANNVESKEQKNSAPAQTANAKPSLSAARPDDLNKKSSKISNSLEVDHPLQKALNHAYQSQKAMRDIADYEATFSKRVLINGQLNSESMLMKIREKPFSVYLKYANSHKGREVLFIEGRNGNKILAHESGFKSLAGTISLQPTSKLAMEGNVYPITEIGMSNLLDMMIVHWEGLQKHPQCKVQLYNQAKLSDVPCTAIEVTTPLPVEGIDYHMFRLYFDKQNNLPVHVELYGFPIRAGEQPPLVEEYTYTQLKLNVGLSDHDFSTKNQAYKF